MQLYVFVHSYQLTCEYCRAFVTASNDSFIAQEAHLGILLHLAWRHMLHSVCHHAELLLHRACMAKCEACSVYLPGMWYIWQLTCDWSDKGRKKWAQP